MNAVVACEDRSLVLSRQVYYEYVPHHRLGTPDGGDVSPALSGPGRFVGRGDRGRHGDHGGRDRAGAPAPAPRSGSGEVSPDATEAGSDDRRAAARAGGGRTRADGVGLRHVGGPDPDRDDHARGDRRACAGGPGQAAAGRGAGPQRGAERPGPPTSRASSGFTTTPSLPRRPISNRRITCSWPSV